MRILLVSGTSVGGAARSTHDLAAALAGRGHEVAVLTAADEAERTRRWHEHWLDAGVRLPRPLCNASERVRRRIGRRVRDESLEPYPSWRAPVPENALAGVLDRVQPDVVVVASVSRPAWRQMHALLGSRRIPRVLYMRERTATLHFLAPVCEPEVLLANSHGHAAAAAELGHEARVIPSLVDVGNCLVDSTRERVVFINPVELFGVDIALALAAARPDVPFTFVRSWPLDDAEERALAEAVAPLPNVELVARYDDPREVYRHARVVLVPYRHPGRPRVVAEAHANGLPVLGSTEEGVAEAVGPGGLTVAVDADPAEWARALGELWDDPRRYDELAAAARDFAARPEMQREEILDRFEAALAAADRRRRDRAPELGAAVDVSVIVPAHDAAATLPEQVAAITAQQADCRFEVLVVDNGSDDTTAATVLALARRDPRIRLVPAHIGRGPSHARNAGARAAHGAVLVFCDADDVVAEGWLQAMYDGVRSHRFVGGPLEVDRLNPAWLVEGRGRAVGQAPVQYGAIAFAHGCNFGIERDLLLAHPFDETVRAGEEIDLAVRLARFGVRCHGAPGAVVHYRYRPSARATWRQAFIVGRAQRVLRARMGDAAPPTRVARRTAWLLWNVPKLGGRAGRIRWAWIAGDMAGRVASLRRVRPPR